jgi:ubiquinone/menaquinone biosynthesis C-methylase UbiE
MNDEASGLAPSVALPSSRASAEAPDDLPVIPDYLRETYWWAYLHPNAIHVFEREWLVNLILWGNMSRLTQAVLEEIPGGQCRDVLQLACVYGRFSDRLAAHLAPGGAKLHLLDIAAIQLRNARRKLAPHRNVRYHHQDSSALCFHSGCFDASVLFFLLHEQPEPVRRDTLREALRVTKPGGKLVIVDYHGPGRMNPWRYLMRPVLHWLEPFALDLWRHPMAAFLPRAVDPGSVQTTLYFGGLYQKTVIQLPH